MDNLYQQQPDETGNVKSYEIEAEKRIKTNDKNRSVAQEILFGNQTATVENFERGELGENNIQNPRSPRKQKKGNQIFEQQFGFSPDKQNSNQKRNFPKKKLVMEMTNVLKRYKVNINQEAIVENLAELIDTIEYYY